MPTDQENESIETPPVEDNAEQDTSVDEDAVKASPHYQDMERKYKDARKGLDEKAKELKKLRRLEEALSEDSEPEVATGDSPEAYVDWRSDNADDIRLAGDQFEKELADLKDLGVELSLKVRQKALENALAKKGIKESSVSTSVAQGTQSTERDTDEHLPEAKLAELAMWGISKETYLKHKDEVGRR